VIFAIATLAVLGTMGLAMVRALKGPTVFDRLLGVTTVGAKTISMILVIGYLYGRIDMFVDIALGYAILNFVGGLTMAKYYKTSPGA